ncbi:MAG: endonuclease III domain-containing protein [Sphaerochaetaceae bacterium]
MNIDWDNLFEKMRLAVVKEGKDLPSVSTIALEKHDPYHVLISTLISLRTKDAVTISASYRLFELADTPQQMVSLNQQQIEEAIYPAGFYRNKAKNILEISHILIDQYDSLVPSTQQELMSLPGVGIKTANLTLNLGFGIDAICVDIHVHRISNRMGWIATKTPEESEKALQHVMPQRFWIPLNELLVSFGQTICTPVSPHCSKCPVYDVCKRVGVTKSR